MVTITGRALLERIVGKDHAREITRRDGVFDNSQTTTFKPEYALRDLLQNGLPGDCDGKTLDILVDPKERTAVIRDDGTGFTYYRLARCSSTKIGSTTAAGLFGRGGTKEAPMTLALDGAGVIFRTQDWAALGVAIPNPAEGVIMLDYDYVGNLPKIKGTEIHLVGLSDAMIRYLQRPEDEAFVVYGTQGYSRLPRRRWEGRPSIRQASRMGARHHPDSRFHENRQPRYPGQPNLRRT